MTKLPRSAASTSDSGVAWRARKSVEGRPLDETQLIQRARQGDAAAYRTLVEIHQQVALRVAYLVVRDHDEAEDVAQEALVKAFAHLDRFRDGEPFRPWLLRIVRNQGLNHRRSAGRRQQLMLRAAAQPTSGDAAPSPETAAMEAEQRRLLLAAVDALPSRYRIVIGCRYLVDLSEAETARILGVPAGTIKSRTARALARLRRMLPAELAPAGGDR